MAKIIYPVLVDAQNDFINGVLGTKEALCCAGTTPENHNKDLNVMGICHIDIENRQ